VKLYHTVTSTRHLLSCSLPLRTSKSIWKPKSSLRIAIPEQRTYLSRYSCGCWRRRAKGTRVAGFLHHCVHIGNCAHGRLGVDVLLLSKLAVEKDAAQVRKKVSTGCFSMNPIQDAHERFSFCLGNGTPAQLRRGGQAALPIHAEHYAGPDGEALQPCKLLFLYAPM
jgi:hypothetical protein